MKRYLVFSGLNYYKLGGIGDFNGCFDTLEEAKKQLDIELFLFLDKDVWGYVYDTVDKKKVI